MTSPTMVNILKIKIYYQWKDYAFIYIFHVSYALILKQEIVKNMI